MTTAAPESVAAKILKVVIGFLVYVVLAIIDPTGSMGLLLGISVICTFGSGLIFWIGVWYLIGLVVVTLYTRLIRQKGAAAPIRTELQAYVVSARQARMSDGEIRNNLARVGWAKNEIEAAIEGKKYR